MSQQPERHSKFRAHYVPWAVSSALVLAIFAGTIIYATDYARQRSREQIINQSAQILYELWLSRKSGETDPDMLAPIENPADQIATVLETARLPQLNGLLGMRLFDARGVFFFADKPYIDEAKLGQQELNELKDLKPVARFRPSANLNEFRVADSDEFPAEGPLLEVCIPLHSPMRREVVAIAQFILDGGNVRDEFAKLDGTLIVQAGLTFLVGGGLLTAVLGLGFRKLQRMNVLLLDRTQTLLRANEELALAAKTSAVGAVTAHLIHGLKNPLSGLENFVASRGLGIDDSSGTDWKLAVASAKRMQTMISEIVRVLREDTISGQYELTLEEFQSILESKVRPLSTEAGVTLEIVRSVDATLQNREASLISLILYNLVQNALQATPRGCTVTVAFTAQGDRIIAEVRDQGSGIPPAQRANLFKPCQSGKEGGSGIGLAISKQLANSIEAELELKETGTGGTVFVLAFRPSGKGDFGEVAAGTFAP